MRWVFAWCAAPTGVRLAAITAGESESESQSESERDGKDDGERAAAPAAGASGLPRMPMESFTQDHVDAFFGFVSQ